MLTSTGNSVPSHRRADSSTVAPSLAGSASGLRLRCIQGVADCPSGVRNRPEQGAQGQATASPPAAKRVSGRRRPTGRPTTASDDHPNKRSADAFRYCIRPVLSVVRTASRTAARIPPSHAPCPQAVPAELSRRPPSGPCLGCSTKGCAPTRPAPCPAPCIFAQTAHRRRQRQGSHAIS